MSDEAHAESAYMIIRALEVGLYNRPDWHSIPKSDQAFFRYFGRKFRHLVDSDPTRKEKLRPMLTPMQARMLAAIRELSTGEVGPSFEELKARLALRSKSQVHRLVKGLVARGALQMEYGGRRSMRVL